MTAEPLVVREDLSERTVLSKSWLQKFEFCQREAWYQLRDPRKAIPNEKMTFGSAVDAGVEQIVVALRSGQTVHMEHVMAAAEEVIARDEIDVDLRAVERATSRFMVEVAPHYDWAFCRTQAAISLTFDDFGEASGHPDIILRGNHVWDVKTSGKRKPNQPTVELGWYALLVEEETGKPVPTVGYFTWVRTGKPLWQITEFPVTDELRRWARMRVGAAVDAKKADALLNKRAATPRPFAFPGGPAWPGKCDDCPYAPAFGGPCEIAYQGEAVA